MRRACLLGFILIVSVSALAQQRGQPRSNAQPKSQPSGVGRGYIPSHGPAPARPAPATRPPASRVPDGRGRQPSVQNRVQAPPRDQQTEQPRTFRDQPSILKRRTSIRMADSGSATRPAVTIRTTTSIIPGSTGVLRWASVRASSTGSREETASDSGFRTPTSKSRRMTTATWMIGIGTATMW
jgi:hypothetical protein